jgi:ATP-dependent DNA helicase RecG
MALPVNIEELLQGTVVEWERLEFKEGWNPEDIIHSICAFANDLNNWGGGYLIVGVAEAQGRALLPPVGLQVNQLDAIQKKLVELCYLLEPFYFPVIQPVLFQDRHILVVWVPGGDNRPYKAPIALGERGQKTYYVRRGATSARVNATEERRLLELAAKVPFDDRVNHHAQVEDLSLALIQGFLQEVGSDLYGESTKLSLLELGQQMRIVQGPVEYIKPLNIGLLLFSERPDRYFRGAAIDVVIYRDEHGEDFVEKTFWGPLHVQLRQALEYLRTNVIREEVRKVVDRQG